MNEGSAAIQTTERQGGDVPGAVVAVPSPAATSSDITAHVDDAGPCAAGWFTRPQLNRMVLAGLVLLIAGGMGFSTWQHQNITGHPPLPETAGPVQQQPRLDPIIASMEQRVSDKPDEAEGWRMLGWSYFQAGRYREAATALRRATRLDPENAEGFSFLGEALFMASAGSRRMPRDARRAFEKALQLDPEDARARHFRAVAMDLDGRHRAAISAWFKLLADTPADAPHAREIRDTIVEVARRNQIDISKRLAAATYAPPASGLAINRAVLEGVTAPAVSDAEMRAASLLPPGQQEAVVREMVGRIEAQLKTQPRDSQGWIMLMRSRMQLGEPAAAGRALEQSIETFNDDPGTQGQLRSAAARIGVPGA